MHSLLGALSRATMGRSIARRLAPAVLIAAWLIGVYAIVRATGGTPNPLSHLAYIAILVAALTQGLRASVIAGVAAGLLLGPLMPDSTAATAGLLGQWGWLVRFVSFAVAGVIVGVIYDVSRRRLGDLRIAEQRQRLEAAALAHEELLRRLVEATPIGMAVFNIDGRVSVINSAVEQLVGRSRQQFGDTDGESGWRVTMPSGEMLGNPGTIAQRIIRAGVPLPETDLTVERPDGTVIVISMTITPIRDAAGEVIGAAMSLRDVTAERALERRREARADEFRRAAAAAAAGSTALAAGQRLLVEFSRIWPVVSAVIYIFEAGGAHRLATWTGPGVSVEYPIRATDAESERLRELAAAGRPVRVALERVVADAVALDTIERHGGRAEVIVPLVDEGMLVGVLLAADSHEPAILDAADGARLADFGQICAAVVHRASRDEEVELGRFRDRIGLVLEQPRLLVPVFQPIVSFLDGRVVGYEALARFAVEPFQPPNVWFEQAERVGLGPDLQALALHRALAVAGAAGLPRGVFLSLNVSPRLLAHPAIGRALRGAALQQIVLEITEEEAVIDYASARANLAPYRTGGARVAIDDAGAGYASLRHVTELRPDYIKLDAQLTANLSDNETRMALVRALQGFASEIGAVLIIEGVERAEDLELLARTRSLILGQGYALAPPAMPWSAILPDARQAIRGAHLRRVALKERQQRTAGERQLVRDLG